MKKYVIIQDVNAVIDFSQVDQDGINNDLVDNLQQRFVISYNNNMPDTIKNIENKSQEYTKEQIIQILADPNWSIYDNFGPDNTLEYDDHIKFYEEIL